MDTLGNLYATDTNNGRVRYMNRTSGLVYTVVGGGSQYEDGHPATSTVLRSPKDILVSTLGVVYISDSEDHSVRKMDPSTGLISTVAGVGSLFFGGDGGLAIYARLNSPTGIWVGLFFCYKHNRLRIFLFSIDR